MKTQDMQASGEGWKPSHDELNDWLKTRIMCSFSTLDRDGAPESAYVAFSVTGDGDYIIGTSEDSRKVHNIDNDSRASMAVIDMDARLTAQIKGKAKKLSQAAFAKLANEHYRQRPESLPFRDKPGQMHILVSPSYIKFSDCSSHPWTITEYEL